MLGVPRTGGGSGLVNVSTRLSRLNDNKEPASSARGSLYLSLPAPPRTPGNVATAIGPLPGIVHNPCPGSTVLALKRKSLASRGSTTRTNDSETDAGGDELSVTR